MSAQLIAQAKELALAARDDYATFVWNADTFLYSPVLIAQIVAVYFVTIFSLRGYVKYVRGGKGLPGSEMLFAIHNFILSILSFIMFAGALVEIVFRVQQEGFQWFACEHVHGRAAGPLYFWSYMYFLSKFYELLDTVFLAAKGSELTFFQIYHHTVVIAMCWLWLETSQSLQFGGLLFNTFVHIIMYYYFGLRSCGIAPWWRLWVTKTQIIQFVTSGVLFFYTMYLLHLQKEQCAGENALYFNFVFNMSLLGQFVDLFFNGRKSSKKDKTTITPAASKKD